MIHPKIIEAFKVLELDENATMSHVKRQYHQLAKKYHPDTHQDTASNSKFIEITNAYNLLSEYFENPLHFSIYSSLKKERNPTNEPWSKRFSSKEEYEEHLHRAKEKVRKRQEELDEIEKNAYLTTRKPLLKYGHLLFTVLAVFLISFLLIDYFSPREINEVNIKNYALLNQDYDEPQVGFLVVNDGKTEEINVSLKILYEDIDILTESILLDNHLLDMNGKIERTKYLNTPINFSVIIDNKATKPYRIYEYSLLRKVTTMCVLLSFSLLLYLFSPKNHTLYVFTFYSTWTITTLGILIVLVNGTGGRIITFMSELL